MKVIIVSVLAECRGGGELMLLHLFQQNQNSAIKWHVVFLNDGPMLKQVADMGIPVTLIQAGRIREIHNLLLTARKIAALAKQIKASFIFGWCAKEHLYSGLAAKIAGLPSAWYQLGGPTKRGVVGWANRIPASGIICLSRAGQEAQKALTPHLEIPLVYPGVELERFDPVQLPSPKQAREQLNLPLDKPIIGIVGRLQRWKGMHTLIQAMPHLLPDFPDLQAVIVGGRHSDEAEYEDWLHAQVRDLSLDKNVHLVGLQTNAQLWMQAMDIVIHASVGEPFGIVVIEAMALGKPVVAGNTGGPLEIIRDGVDGLLTPYEDASAMAQAIRQYLEDPEFARNMGIKARERAQQFSTKNYAKNFRDAIETLAVPKH